MRWQVFAALCLCFSASTATGREWTDISGKYHVQARLLQRHDNTVWLENENARLVLVPFDKLSLADQAYVTRECPAEGTTRLDTSAVASQPPAERAELPARPAASLVRDRQKAVIRFASLSRQPEDEAPEMTIEEEAVETPEEVATPEELPGPTVVSPEKFIYSGRCGTFHLVGKLGTGAYWYKGKHYLAMLFKAGEDANYLYYDSNTPDGQIIQWYFSKTERCCKFWVWKRTPTGHGHYEREHREIPH